MSGTKTAGDKQPFLQIEHMTKRFGQFTALDRISLQIERGEFVCFLGPSGCGKTTLLRAIAGLDLQDEGRVTMDGRDVSFAPPSARDFGIVFQSYALFPNLTVSANVGYGLVNQRWSKSRIKERVTELLALVGLPDQGDKYPVQLSGGQQQRVALARALATSPGLLLLDEPLSALDARVRLRLREQIRDLQRDLGVTTIMVTHDQEEALTMADRIVVMNHGVIEQIGTPIEVYATPATAFVADFVGTMSFFEGTLQSSRKLKVAGIDLACSDDRGLAAGTKVTVGLRPEEVRVRDVTADTPNRVAVYIDDLEFMGAFCRARLLTVSGDVPILADFSVNLMRDMAVSVGKHLTVALPEQSLHVFATPIDELTTEEAA
ncbi:MAG: putative 2-aminoethylphosphonate ABC transporter ATP-binding protein [Natronohydrobacter sp.]|nr:putative 2-aminoethylphosphonate ABC transporter ATP-binding protein [Natronohydrobacter sp.]